MKKPTAYLLCGLPGSGKSTYAKSPERKGLTVLSIDDVIVNQFGVAGKDYPFEKHTEYKHIALQTIKETIAMKLTSGESIILDFGVGKKKERDYFRSLIEENGGTLQLLYFKVDIPVLLERIRKRNIAEDGKAVFVTKEMLERKIALFEEPNGEGERIAG